MNAATIMEIERFAVHDGPGIRTTFFFKGCPLRCPWCANPESQSMQKEIMYQEKKCFHCGKCKETCRQGAIQFVNGKPKLNSDLCLLCGDCVKNCPGNALNFSGELKTAKEILTILKKDKDYYDLSNGGVTFSGGEAFCQFEVMYQLAQMCKTHNMKVALETCGDTNYKNIEKILPYIDLFLFDLKFPKAEDIALQCKGNGQRILQNLEKLCLAAGDKTIIRIPCIPNYNFQYHLMTEMLNMAKRLEVLEVHLLPYHNLGKYKYKQLQRSYALDDTPSLKKEALIPYINYGEKIGIRVKIGE